MVVTGGVGIGGNVNIGGTVTGGGIRTTSTSTAPAGATVGDIWYNTTTDDIYRYTSDGTTSAWIDITGPTGSTPAVVSYTQPQLFAYFTTGGQSLTGGVDTKISFTNKNWDTANAFNNTASPVTLNGLTVPAYSFCPPIAGYYKLTGMVQFASGGITSCVDFFKNGSFDTINGYRGELAAAQGPAGSAIVYLNGTGDYVDMRVYAATTVAVMAQSGANYFQASYLGNGIGYNSASNSYTGVTQIQSAAPLTPPVIRDSAGVEIGKFAWAWVNFVGGATPTINASFNISSVTYSSTGVWNITFTNALSTSSYVVVMGQGQNSTNNNTSNTAYNYATTGLTVAHFENNAVTNLSPNPMFVAIFR